LLSLFCVGENTDRSVSRGGRFTDVISEGAPGEHGSTGGRQYGNSE